MKQIDKLRLKLIGRFKLGMLVILLIAFATCCNAGSGRLDKFRKSSVAKQATVAAGIDEPRVAHCLVCTGVIIRVACGWLARRKCRIRVTFHLLYDLFTMIPGLVNRPAPIIPRGESPWRLQVATFAHSYKSVHRLAEILLRAL